MGGTNSYDEEIMNMYKFWFEIFLETITENRGGEWNVTLKRL
jgi:hypothetical protein